MTNISTHLSYLAFPDYSQLDNPAPIEQIWAVRHDRSQLVRCHNMSSARAIAEGRAPSRNDEVSTTTVNVKAFVSPTGQYYVMHGNQRMDVANAATARYYAKNGVALSIMIAASLENLSKSLNQ